MKTDARVGTETPTPTGEAGLLLTCDNPQHRHSGKSAIIRFTTDPIAPDRACKLVDVAHHPFFSRAQSTRQAGPWKA